MKLNCKKLNELIAVIDNKNKNEKYTELLGININKEFIKSVANTVGTDLTKYKVIENECFACNLMHVGRDKKIPMALYKGTGAIVSPAYYVFKVKNKEEILPEYLELYFNKEEFDNKMYFLSQNGIRGNLDWKDFANETISYPSLEEQIKIVNVIKLIDKYILDTKTINNNIQRMGLTLFKGISKYDRKEKLSSLCKIISKGTTPRSKKQKEENTIPFIKVKDLSEENIVYKNVEYISEFTHTTELKRSILYTNDILISIAGTIGKIAIVPEDLNNSNTNQAIAFIRLSNKKILGYIYFWLQTKDAQDKIKNNTVQAVQANISLTSISDLECELLGENDDLYEKFNLLLKTFLKNNEKINVLRKARKIILAKAMSGELNNLNF